MIAATDDLATIRWGAAFTRDVLGFGVHGACFAVTKGLYMYIGLARLVSHACCEFGSNEPRPETLLICATLQAAGGNATIVVTNATAITHVRHAAAFGGLDVKPAGVHGALQHPLCHEDRDTRARFQSPYGHGASIVPKRIS